MGSLYKRFLQMQNLGLHFSHLLCQGPRHRTHSFSKGFQHVACWQGALETASRAVTTRGVTNPLLMEDQ